MVVSLNWLYHISHLFSPEKVAHFRCFLYSSLGLVAFLVPHLEPELLSESVSLLSELEDDELVSEHFFGFDLVIRFFPRPFSDIFSPCSDSDSDCLFRFREGYCGLGDWGDSVLRE